MIYSYPRAEINKLIGDITVDNLSDAMVTILQQAPDFFNPETGTREMVNVSNFDVFIRLELAKVGDYLVSKQTQGIYKLATHEFINQVVIASMKKIPKEWIPIN